MTTTATEVKKTPNKKQQDCIDNIQGKYLVLAGPGTGKTFTIIERIKNMLNQGIEAEKIAIPQKTGIISTDDIFDNIKAPCISEDKIKEIILNERKIAVPKAQRSEFTKALCKFLDEFSCVYSPNSMALDLIQLHAKAKSKFKSNQGLLYCVATDEKSPAYITSIYVKLNNINPIDVTICTNKDTYELASILHNKEGILIDDNSITAGSILGIETDIPSPDTHWFVLLATNEAVKKLNDTKNKPIPKSFNYQRLLKNQSNKNDSISETKLLSQQELDLIKNNINWGYEGSGVLCAFPHMIPDNCIDIGAVLFENLLYRNTPETNKPIDGYNNRINGVQDKPVSFKGNYKPVSQTEPNYNLLNCDYCNIDEFAELFAQKVNSQLRTIKPSDVQALCERIQDKTGADFNLIYKVLYQLTLFSGYDTINFLQKIADNYLTRSFGIKTDYYRSSKCTDISSNVSLSYLAKNKGLITPCENLSLKNLVVLDRILLQELEQSKNQKSDFYKAFINNLRQDRIKILNFKGWDVECSDGVYRSCAFLYGTGQLEDLAVDTLQIKKSS